MERTFRDGHTRPGTPPTRRWAGGVRRLHPPGGCHRRPGRPAGQGHLVPGHEPAPARRPARGRQPAPGGGPGRDRAVYGIRHWIEQGYKQVKDQLGWADFQVRSDTAIRRHQVLFNCAFCFCWAAWFAENPPPQETAAPRPEPGRGERGAARRTAAGAVLAPGRCARYAPGFPPGSRCSAGGRRGPRRPRTGSCKP